MPYQALADDWPEYDDETDDDLNEEEVGNDSAGEEMGGNLEDEVHEDVATQSLEKTVDVVRAEMPVSNDQHGEAPPMETIPREKPRSNLRVSKDAWSWSDTEDEVPPTVSQAGPSYVTLSSDSEVTEPQTSRKRKRNIDLQEHDAISHQPKRTRSQFTSSFLPSPRVVDTDPLLQTHDPKLLPSRLLSVGSITFPASRPFAGRRNMIGDASEADGSLPEGEHTTPDAVASAQAKRAYSTGKSAVSSREHRARKGALEKCFHRRYIADRSALFHRLGKLQRDSRWNHMSEDERKALKAVKMQETMEQRFADGRSEAAFLSHLLQLASKCGYSEGVLLRLLLQKEKTQKLLGEILKDVIDVDEAGNLALSRNSNIYSSARTARWGRALT